MTGAGDKWPSEAGKGEAAPAPFMLVCSSLRRAHISPIIPVPTGDASGRETLLRIWAPETAVQGAGTPEDDTLRVVTVSAQMARFSPVVLCLLSRSFSPASQHFLIKQSCLLSGGHPAFRQRAAGRSSWEGRALLPGLLDRVVPLGFSSLCDPQCTPVCITFLLVLCSVGQLYS